MPVIKHCPICGKEFKVKPSQANQRFCSIKCRSIWQRGENNPKAKIGRIELKKELIEWIDGHLLGDGRIGNPKSSYYFEQSFSPKFEEYAKFVQKELKSLGLSAKFDKRVIKASEFLNIPSHELLFVRTLYYRELKFFRDRFYFNGKSVPRDLKVTPILLRNWYLDDGSLSKFSKGGWYRVRLAVCDFNEQDVLFLQKLLAKELGVFVVIERHKGKIRELSINRKNDIKKFFNYIGDCPVKCYEYKWPE